MSFFQAGFGKLFGVILGSFWEPFCINFRCFFRSKNASVFGSLSGGLLEGFGQARPSKMRLSYTRNAHFDKVTFSVPGRISDAKWSPKGSQNGGKKPSNFIEKSEAFFDRKM